MCSPPLRLASDQDSLWRAIALGDIEVLSSDHAPYRLDADGKYPRGEASTFKEIANGMPGIEARLPLLFDAMVSKGRLGIRKFVEATATAPARIYNLGRKGSIAVGLDADLAIWDPECVVTLDDAMMHDNAGYSPYAGRMLQGWPQIVLSRGRVVVEGGQLRVAPGSGRFLARSGGPSATPAGSSAGRLISDSQAECLTGRGPSKD
jgi:dihydropyrimidinase